MCLQCDPGAFNDIQGATACLACAAGKYASDPSSYSCLSCTPGRYSPAKGGMDCLACPLGRYTDTPGATNCTECRAGSHGSTQAATSCELCTAGTYLPTTGAPNSSLCTLCPPAKFSTVSGLASAKGCIACPKGSSGNGQGTGCEGCAGNTFFDIAFGACVSCPKNSLGVNATSADECTCLQGFYQSYNTKAYGGRMSYSEGEGNTVYRNHVFGQCRADAPAVQP